MRRSESRLSKSAAFGSIAKSVADLRPAEAARGSISPTRHFADLDHDSSGVVRVEPPLMAQVIDQHHDWIFASGQREKASPFASNCETHRELTSHCSSRLEDPYEQLGKPAQSLSGFVLTIDRSLRDSDSSPHAS